MALKVRDYLLNVAGSAPIMAGTHRAWVESWACKLCQFGTHMLSETCQYISGDRWQTWIQGVLLPDTRISQQLYVSPHSQIGKPAPGCTCWQFAFNISWADGICLGACWFSFREITGPDLWDYHKPKGKERNKALQEYQPCSYHMLPKQSKQCSTLVPEEPLMQEDIPNSGWAAIPVQQEPKVVHWASTSEENHDAQAGGTHLAWGRSKQGDQADEEDVPMIFYPYWHAVWSSFCWLDA